MEHPIPRKVHHIYWNWGPDGEFLPDEGPVPEFEGLQRWRQLHPGYDVHVWTRRESFAFAQQHFPDLWPTFMGYSRHIQRCDMFRIMLLAQLGGIYSDIDVMPFRTHEDLLATYRRAGCICATEIIVSPEYIAQTAQTYPIRQGVPEHPIRLANYWLAAAPHPILHAILREMLQRASLPLREDYDVLYTTGPDVVTTVIHRDQELYEDVIYIPEAEAARYIKHENAGSWRQQH